MRRIFADGGLLSPKSAFGRTVAGAMAALLVAAGLVVGAVVSPAMADALISLQTKGDTAILAGEKAKISLTATGSASNNLYNVAFRYELPPGVTYDAGTATGADKVGLAEPTIITVIDSAGPPEVKHQVLIWSNLADLPKNDTASLAFTVTPDPAVYPVGSSFSGTASVYAPTDPRKLVKFDKTTGVVTSGTYSASDVQPGVTTKVNAIEITKSEPSPEHELMRGVHDQTTVYTLTTRNTGQAPTDNVVVVDYLPAEMEFLGCAQSDNSSPATEEYPGAGRLDTVDSGAHCVNPVSVETINDRPGFGSAVFTKVTWNLGTLAGLEKRELTYAAGIPLFANEMWPAPAPAIDGAQRSNLDNNTGHSTRQKNPAERGQALKNTVVASGNYTGPVKSSADRATSSTDDLTVRAMDLSIVKSTTAPGFVTGGIATFSLLLRSSEYVDNSAMTITDTIPNGLCPLVPASVTITNNTGRPLPVECQTADVVDGATITAAVANADGTFTITMAPDMAAPAVAGQLDHNLKHTITYTAYMNPDYEGNGTGSSWNGPTVAGDSFANTVEIAGSSADVTTSQESGLIAVEDDSKATLGTTSPTIAKRVLQRPLSAGSQVDCAAAPDANYVDGTANKPVYQLGDLICFKLEVNFSSSTRTRNAAVTDFVPVGTKYHGFSVAGSGPLDVPASQVVADIDSEAGNSSKTDPARWLIGALGADGARYVDKGAKLTMYVVAEVTETSSSTGIDITANLMKYRQESTAGTVLSLRDQVDFGVSAPVVALDKSTPKANVKEGDVVPFTLSVTNDGDATKGHIFDVRNAVVWDVLPVGLNCSTVSAVTPAGTCYNYGDAGYPENAVASSPDAKRSAIVWTIPGPIAPGANATLSYNVTIPAEVSVSTVFTNNASVVKFTSPNTAGGNTEYFPTGSLDDSPATKPKWNTPAANDTETVRLADATVAKTGVTKIVETNNDADHAVAGEAIDYTYSVTVPAGTTVFNGVLSDALPTGLALTAGSTVTAKRDSASLPTGFTLDSVWNSSTAGKLTFPDTYDNTTATAQVFSVTLTDVRVAVDKTSGTLRNTATFVSNATLGGTPLPDRTGSTAITVIAPAPTLDKSVNPTSASGGDIVTFTLVAGNTAGAPAAYDAVVVDCLPAGLDFRAFLTAPAGTGTSGPVNGNGVGVGDNGCAVGTKKLTWTLPGTGALLAPATQTFTFDAIVNPSSAGNVSYTNNATVTGSTLANGSNDKTTELVVTATDDATVAILGATTTKTVAKPTATIGETVDYTISVAIPPHVNFYNAAIIDTLPAGITADAGTATVTCTFGGGADCLSSLPGAGAALTAAPGLIGWSLGNVTANAQGRTITISLQGTVVNSDATNIAGAVRQNQAHLAWNTTDKGDPTTAAGPFDESGDKGTASVTLHEPSLTIGKVVSNATPEPGERFTYTVTVRNANTATTSDAHDVTIVDTLPVGIDPTKVAAISNGGTITGNKITWTIPSIAKNASVTLSYTAVLAASSTIGATGQTNTVNVTSYSSLPGAPTEERVYTGPSASATVTPDFPRVTVQKDVASGSVAYAGTPFGWKITLVNTGRGTAKALTATDTLPVNWEYTAGSGSYTVNGGASVALTDPTITTASGKQTLVWAPFANVAPGATIVINFTSTPTQAALTTPGVGAAVKHTNTVSATATDPTDAPGNKDNPSYAGGPDTADAYIHSADVTLVKAAGDRLVAGSTTAGAWTITVSNAGPQAANGLVGGNNFRVTDTPGALPAGVTVTAASGTGWTCTVPNTTTGAFTCDRTSTGETLAVGASFPVITVSVAVAANVASGTTVANSATVASKTYDPQPGNNTEGETLTTTTSADLTIAKTITSGTVGAGSAISWNLAPTNLGPSVSLADITITDTVPTGVAGVVATGTDWDCDATTANPADAGDTITCTYTGNGGVMAVGAAPPVSLTGTVKSSYTGGPISNTAAIAGGSTTDPVPGNNASTITTGTPGTSTTLGIEKTLIAPTAGTPPIAGIVPGDNAVYQITVTNNGPADARNVTVTDELPAGLTYVSGTGTTGTWTCDDSAAPSIVCTLSGTLSAASGSNTAVLDLTVSTDSNLTGNVLNEATAKADNALPVTDDTDSGSTGSADLEIVKSHPAGAVLAGRSLDYTLTVTNNGPSDSPGPVTVVDTVPVGLVPTAASGTGWSCSLGAATAGGTPVTCERTASLVDGASAPDITVTVDVPAALSAQTLVNTATVDGPLDDPKPSNDTANDPTVVTTDADVSIVKDVASAGPFVAGQSVDFTVTVVNAGPSVANSARVADLAPVGMTVTALSGAGWTCTVATADCARAVLPVGTFTIDVTASIDQGVADGTNLENVAVLTWTDSSGSHTEQDPADVTVTAIADLSLAKTAVDTKGDPVSTVTAGSQGRYLLTVHNDGPSAAVAPLKVVDQLPVGMSYVGVADSADWTCTAGAIDASGQTVDCEWAAPATIAAGADAHALTLVVHYDAALPVGDVTNTAVVSSATTDPNPANDTDDATVTIAQQADLSITKSHAGSVRIGDSLSFDLAVRNDGPSVATGIRVVDSLPVGLDFQHVDASDPAWTCTAGAPDADGTEVSCDLSVPVAPGDAAPALKITALVQPAAYPTVKNIAVVSSTTPESDPTDNTAEDAVEVPAQAALTVAKTSVGSLQVGRQGSYLITVSNAGPTEDPGPVTITDVLPAGLSFVGSSSDDASCAASGQTVTCTIEDAIAVGATVSLKLTVQVGEKAFPSVTNLVTASSPTEQLPTAELTDSDTSSVAAAPPLAISGVDVLWAGIAALLLLILGAVLMVWRRTRRSAR